MTAVTAVTQHKFRELRCASWLFNLRRPEFFQENGEFREDRCANLVGAGAKMKPLLEMVDVQLASQAVSRDVIPFRVTYGLIWTLGHRPSAFGFPGEAFAPLQDRKSTHLLLIFTYL